MLHISAFFPSCCICICDRYNLDVSRHSLLVDPLGQRSSLVFFTVGGVAPSGHIEFQCFTRKAISDSLSLMGDYYRDRVWINLAIRGSATDSSPPSVASQWAFHVPGLEVDGPWGNATGCNLRPVDFLKWLEPNQVTTWVLKSAWNTLSKPLPLKILILSIS